MKNPWERWDSNPGMLVEESERYLCAMPPPDCLLLTTVSLLRSQLSGINFLTSFSDNSFLLELRRGVVAL